ncbi:phosphoglucomutase [Capsaspora owczarzaki ATCC 30864]|uniref:Phosphoglucomutase n=2 Tax=Capsaspora owczarzaki (strain ATCC 30864) TaxID=595528 RepID=A0A0D2WJN3_CAPO3|nr:phosphoglucomutase [Capsaspora owczarzaki ATCC 30864]
MSVPSVGDASLDQLVQQWLSLDQNPKTRKEITDLVEAGNKAELHTRLDARMEFGTAGLRAAMAAGYSRMNDVTIIQTAQGFARYVEDVQPDAKSMGVAIGYDARHNSQRWAQLSALALVARGIKVYLFSAICPTPFVPFAVCKYKTAAGVMVTASHNPKNDNGYKVYWGNGAQIISPHDKGIASHIEENLQPWPTAWDVSALESNDAFRALVVDPLAEVTASYMDAIREHSIEGSPRDAIKITYTAMHGVGLEFAMKAYETFGLPPFVQVAEQVHPDPEFPTVKFPNPEEGKSALDLSIRTANANDSPVIVANDPDADRLAVAERRPDGSWKIFTGNEIATIFAGWLLQQYLKTHADAKNAACVASTVSSKFLKRMAEVEGCYFEETLTGFKWIGNKVIELHAAGRDIIMSFEEAIGFSVGTVVFDKDGVCASAVMGLIANDLYSRGSTLMQQLEALYLKYGYFASLNSYYLCYSQPTIQKIFQRIRKDEQYPTSCGGVAIRHVRDLTTGYDNSKPGNKATLPTSSSSQMVTFTFENGAVITIRTSGTEPKIKYYTELRGDASSV